MAAGDATLGELVATFQLRREVTPDAFRDGVKLSDSGAVDILEESDRELRAEVLDADLQEVTIRVENGALAGDCSCLHRAGAICRHQVAAAHALWNRPLAN